MIFPEQGVRKSSLLTYFHSPSSLPTVKRINGSGFKARLGLVVVFFVLFWIFKFSVFLYWYCPSESVWMLETACKSIFDWETDWETGTSALQLTQYQKIHEVTEEEQAIPCLPALELKLKHIPILENKGCAEQTKIAAKITHMQSCNPSCPTNTLENSFHPWAGILALKTRKAVDLLTAQALSLPNKD